MTPQTMVAFLGDLIEMDSGDEKEEALIALIASELISNEGEDALMLLSEAAIEHPLISAEFAAWAEEMELEL